MSRKYAGLQVNIKEKCEFAIFVPCAGHSLNLKLYNYFSRSTHRWNTLTEYLGSKKGLKGLSQTRWSARADAVSVLHEGHKQIIEALMSIAQDTEQPRKTRHEALRINLITSNRPSKRKHPESDYKDLSQRTRGRSSRQTFFDGFELSVQLNGREKFTIETFLPITDTLSVHLKQRLSSYKDTNHRFGFFSLENSNSEELKQSCKEFVEIYYEDVSEKELEMECLHLTEYLKIVQSSENEETNSLSGIYHLLKENKIEDTFSNVEVALRIFLSLIVTNCSGERSFSNLKRIKNELRSTVLLERLTSLSLMSIECDVPKDRL
ncbi:hypothetical protein ILUMI_25375 [Ignelater luminosus]|uniref:HAT C-terminal dimerisation domain-containing protein n=1 Tax=Ignelater luminosus TaxID=2038154 RepID=A0A8K0FW98_IGNLU|nr:hypothetical protein ILUMI_25375 [Ignelater luminosus]